MMASMLLATAVIETAEGLLPLEGVMHHLRYIIVPN